MKRTLLPTPILGYELCMVLYVYRYVLRICPLLICSLLEIDLNKNKKITWASYMSLILLILRKFLSLSFGSE